MRILITGATGFIGTHLVKFLSRNDEVYGTYYEFDELSNLRGYQGVELLGCDIRDAQAVDSLIKFIKPQRIYHLAAQSLPSLSWEKPSLTIQTNVIGTINLFESVLKQGLDTRILVACSAAEYGAVSPEEGPTKEDHPLNPINVYGVSKVAQDLLAYQYFVSFGLETVRVRIFNTTGPGKIGDASSDFARQIARIEKGLSPPLLKVGNLHTKRDISDIRDVVRGLYLVMEKGEVGDVYNLCRGEAYKISDMLNTLLNLTENEIEVEIAQELLRPNDEPIIIGDNTKLRLRTGWRPEIPIEETLRSVLDYWREQTRKISSGEEIWLRAEKDPL